MAVEVSGTTVREALSELCLAYPALQEAIFDGEELQAYVRVMVNGRDIELAEGLDTVVDDADQIAVFPPIAGGMAHG